MSSTPINQHIFEVELACIDVAVTICDVSLIDDQRKVMSLVVILHGIFYLLCETDKYILNYHPILFKLGSFKS